MSCNLYIQANVNQKLKNMCNTYDYDFKNFNQIHHTSTTNSHQTIGNPKSSCLGTPWTRTSLLDPNGPISFQLDYHGLRTLIGL